MDANTDKVVAVVVLEVVRAQLFGLLVFTYLIIRRNRQMHDHMNEMVILNDHVDDDEATSSYTSSLKSTGASGTASKKRKRVESSNQLIETMSNCCSKVCESIEKLASRIGHEIDASKRRGELYYAVDGLRMSITMEDHIRVVIYLARNTPAMDVFYGLPEEAKCLMVRMVLDGKL